MVNDGSYTLDNIVRIKAIANDNKETSAPQLIIKGVEK